MDRIGRFFVGELGRGATGVMSNAIDPHLGRPGSYQTIQLGMLRKPEKRHDCAVPAREGHRLDCVADRVLEIAEMPKIR